MKTKDLQCKYYCFDCGKEWVDSQPNIKFSNSYGDWEGRKCECGGNAKIYGYIMGAVMNTAKLNIQNMRKDHRKEILQPYRGGEISKEYLDAYPDKARQMVKEGILTKTQVKKAKNVWGKDDII